MKKTWKKKLEKWIWWKTDLLLEGQRLIVVCVPGVAGRHGQEDYADGRREREAGGQPQRERDARQEVNEQEPGERHATGPRQLNDGHDQHVGRQPGGVGHGRASNAINGIAGIGWTAAAELLLLLLLLLLLGFVAETNVEPETGVEEGHAAGEDQEEQMLPAVVVALWRQRHAGHAVDGHQEDGGEETVAVALFGLLTVALVQLFDAVVVERAVDQFGRRHRPTTGPTFLIHPKIVRS